MSRNAIFSCILGEGKWQVVPVLSPYGPEGHVMMIETRANRYLPTAESIEDEEGDELLRLASSILVETTRLNGDGTINLGYNDPPGPWRGGGEIRRHAVNRHQIPSPDLGLAS